MSSFVLEDITPPSLEEFSKASGVSKAAAENWQKYCTDCRRRSRLISEQIEKFYSKSERKIRVLDWGSAAGGVSIAMKEIMPSIDIYAADLDPYSVNWLARNYSEIKTKVLRAKKPFEWEDNKFDAIFGISVFTHINREDHDFYLSELKRVLTSKGLIILTVHSYKACEYNKKNNKDPKFYPHSCEQLQQAGFIYIRYPEKILANIDFVGDSEYGVAYHSYEFIKDVFGSYFRILEIKEGALGTQDLLVMQNN